MEEIFENKTRYSQKEYDVFLKEYKKEYASSEYASMIFYILFFGLCMIFAFKEKETVLGIVLLIGLVIYIWYRLIRPVIRTEKDRKSPKLSGNFINTYKFYKNYFNVENPEGKAQIFYFKLYRVVETNQYIYIYISRENAFIVSKNGFTNGNPREFSKFIKKKVLFKYKNRIKTNNKTPNY